MPGYADLDEPSQIAVARRAAELALPLLGIDAREITLVTHAFNTTFGVDLVAGGRVAVRVLTNSLADDPHIRGQLAWAQALAVSGIPVPPPWFGPRGEDVVVVSPEGSERDFRVSASWWVRGKIADELSAPQARTLGEVMARMHVQASRWSLPSGTTFPMIEDPFCGYPDLITPALRNAADRAVVAEATWRAQEALDVAKAKGVVAVHGDLHAGNLLWAPGRTDPYVLDLDDAVVAPPVHDLAVAAFYLRRSETGSMRDLFAGYANHRPLPDVRSTTFEGLVAGRQLSLTASLLATMTPGLRTEIEGYLATALLRLRHYLDEGVLDPRIVAPAPA